MKNRKTSMQELFDNLEAIDIKVPIGVKQLFLKKEKEQIADAFYSGDEDRDLFQHGHDYYDKMYERNDLPYQKEYVFDNKDVEVSLPGTELSDIENLTWFFEKYKSTVERGRPNLRAANLLKTYIDLYNDYTQRYNGKPKHNFSHFIRVMSMLEHHSTLIRPKINNRKL